MKKNSFVLIISQGLLLLFVCYADSEPTVQIGETQITGRTIRFGDVNVHQYLSIPYAKPPIGRLRFRKTVGLDRLPKTIRAFDVPPACPQYSERPYPWYVNGSHKSEDCLYLNIWTPADASYWNKKAVFFWVPGGGFRLGSIQSDLYSGEAIAASGDIIVVTVNYRVGLFGFLTTGTKAAPGNAGLWDVLEGLKWVNKYIEYFGGDTSKITIAGESAGSMIVGFLSISDKAKGLYSQQIMESGSPVILFIQTKPLNLAYTLAVAKQVGCVSITDNVFNSPRQVTQCLKRVSAENLIRADFQVFGSSLVDFLPQYGDELLPDNPKRDVFGKHFRCNKLLIGNNPDEGSTLLTVFFPEIFGFFGEKDSPIIMGAEIVKKLINKLQNFLLPMHTHSQVPLPTDKALKNLSDLQPILTSPLSGVTQRKHRPKVLLKSIEKTLKDVSQNAYDFIRHQIYQAFGDFVFVCPDVYYAEKCAEIGGDVYFYLFDHRPSATPYAPWMGVTHFEEVQFVFGRPLRYPNEYQAEEIEISKNIIEQWSNFVKFGQPEKTWPMYRKGNPTYKILGSKNIQEKYKKGFHKRNCELFRSFFILL